MSDWWSRKLNGAPASREAYREPTPPVAPVVYKPSKAQSSRVNDTCPECGSEHYFSDGSAKTQCFDCGHPVRQSGSGVSGGAVSGIPVKAARQVAAPAYVPNQIVGRVQ